MARKARNIESANYSEFSRRHGADVPFHSMKYTIVIGAHVESTNYSEFSRRHGSDVPFYSMKCTIANGVHVAALNRPSPRADLTGPIVTLLEQNPHSPSSLTANIGRYYGLISPSKSFYWRAVGLQHGAMGAHPIRIGLEKEKIQRPYESNSFSSGPLPPESPPIGLFYPSINEFYPPNIPSINDSPYYIS